MRFYIATSFTNRENVRVLSDRLKLEGYIHTYDWTQNQRANSFEELSTIGELEIEAVKNSDLLIILLPAGKGSHIELGIALGLGKRIYIYSPTNELYDFDKTSTFYHIKSVNKFVGTFDTFAENLLEQESERKTRANETF
ncbi:nucleoside 2-deoxyribosyltransferase [Pseudogracilibacillus auburnensis]|uniref:Nucleoside 2-deoxyribosyltransferase-like protein n=1 Tax=Pseudogracilibacillus auburnensis TaxID=1494959 RepID=A0A2V3W7V4_9BACI|nr:nucleoside 2-deoxyribosyltransferase [Pseudogracilibacillus auburnensis]PXW90202.1 hypothetical protein DFR56_101112 [Pseudogracilibacillus auburnensis]